AKTEGIYNAIVKNFSFNNFDLWMSICFLIGAVFLVCVGTVYFLRSKKFIGIICLCYVAAELLYFSNFSVGVWPELDDFNSVLPREQKIYQKIKNDADNFRICPFGEFSKMPFWIRPAMNAVYGIDSISIYTPLADSRYFFMMEGLGTVDDSMGIFPADKGALYKKLNMLSELNVKYIVSTMDLSDPSLEFVLKENKIYLYQLKKFVSRYRFRTNVVSGNAPSFDLLVEKETSGLSMLKIFSENGGRLVFAQKCYPGWEVLVDGQKQVPEFSNGVLQGVVLSGGVHNVIFRYRPICFNVFFPISLTIFIVVALLAITGDRKDE
ncbi:MAG TPA: hypothetical protein PKG81_04220, partial [Candidatus Omnitrophota bacterium]|nr:hypothetical protein [Candidatus Omnitrophota bacterium]